MVETGMFAMAHDHQVLRPVVKGVLVNMMDVLSMKQRAPEFAFHYQPMLRYPPVAIPNEAVATYDRRLSAGPISTLAATESTRTLTGQVVELDVAKLTHSMLSGQPELRSAGGHVARPSAKAVSVAGRNKEGATALATSALVPLPSVALPCAIATTRPGLDGPVAIKASLGTIRRHSDRLLNRLIGVSRPWRYQPRRGIFCPNYTSIYLVKRV
jgi:hypothetical protein